MANRDTEVNNLIINELTKAEFDSAEKSDTELYFVTDEKIQASDIEGLKTINNESIVGTGNIEIKSGVEIDDTTVSTTKVYSSSKVNSLDSNVVHKADSETITGIKTFNGGKISTGGQPGIIVTNGITAGGYGVTGWADISCHRLCDNKINTGSYYMNSDGSIIFRHKTGTATAEGSSNDALLTIHPVNGIKAGFAGTAGGTATQNDVLIDTVNYSKLTTTAKDVLGAINEINAKPSGGGSTPTYIEATKTLKFGGND